MNINNPTENDIGNSDNKNNIGETDPPPILIGDPPKIKPDDPKKNRYWEKIKCFSKVIKPFFLIQKGTRQSLIIWLNIFMLGAFIGFGFYQGCQTREALDMTIVSNNRDSIMSILELRAYFSVDSFKCYFFKSNIIFGKIGIKMINTGKTPVFKISYKNDLRIGREVTQKDFDSLGKTKFKRGSACIGSNQTFTIDVNIFNPNFTKAILR